MTDRERELLCDMDDRAVEEISQFSGGLDDAAKARILEKCKTKMKKDNNNNVVNENTDENTDKDEKETNEINAQIRYHVPNKRMRYIMSAAACIAVMAAAGGIISSLIKKDNIPIVPPVPSEQVTTVSKTDVSVTSSSLNAVTTYVTKSSDVSTAQAIVTSPPVSEAVTTAQESTSSVTESAVNYEDEYLKIFNSIAKPASETYIYLYGFGVQCDSFDGDVIFYDYYTHEIYFHGTGTEYQLNETELRNQYDNAVLAFKLTDPRFKSDTDFVNFIKTYFSDEIAGHCSKDFMYYDNSYYFIWPYGKGLEYDAWQTKDAVISDIVPDKSFVITAYFLDPRYRDEMDDSCKQRLTFVKTDAGWRISRVEDVVSGQVLFPRQ